jgi:hypothetical protein
MLAGLQQSQQDHADAVRDLSASVFGRLADAFADPDEQGYVVPPPESASPCSSSPNSPSALTLSARGHNVILYESGKEIGGQLNMAKLIPGKEDYWLLLAHWTQELKNSNVRVKLNSEFVKEDVSGGHQFIHAVVLCTGCLPRPANSHRIIGAENNRLVLFSDVLNRKVIPGHKVAIIGQGAIAHDIASFLMHNQKVSRDVPTFAREFGVDMLNMTYDPELAADPKRNGRDLVIFQRANHKPGLLRSRGWTLTQRLKAHGTSVFTNCMLGKIDDNGIHFMTPIPNEAAFCLQRDTYIWCYGMLPNISVGTWIYEWVKDGAIQRGQASADFSIYVAGSCRDTETTAGQGEQDLTRAVHEGFEIGQKI